MQGLQALKDLYIHKACKNIMATTQTIFVNIKSIPSFSHQCPIFTFLNGTK